MPAATAEAWRNGWFHTGDQFTQDEDGNFYFLDRIKDVIRRRGENISSFEVETEVMSHPLVKDAAAVAVQTPELEESAGDEEVKVVVVLEPGATLDPAELTEYLAARMPRVLGAALHRVPRRAAPHGVAQAQEGRPARGGDHRRHVGPAEGRHHAQAGSPDLSPLELGPDGPRLVAGRCVNCERVVFPLRERCASCGGSIVRELLPRRGTLWTWTTQGFEPKPPVRARRRVRAVRRRLRRVSRIPPSRGSAHGAGSRAAADRDGRWRSCAAASVRRHVRLRAGLTEIAIIGAGIHPFGRHEGDDRPRDGRPRRACRPGRRGSRVERDRVRLRRQRRRRQRGHARVRAGADRAAVHERQERLRDGRLVARGGRARAPVGGV